MPPARIVGVRFLSGIVEFEFGRIVEVGIAHVDRRYRGAADARAVLVRRRLGRASDGSGSYYFYSHLADFARKLSVGSRVTAGPIIGFMGNTGNSAFAHLRFEIRPNGSGAVNPYSLLRQLGE